MVKTCGVRVALVLMSLVAISCSCSDDPDLGTLRSGEAPDAANEPGDVLVEAGQPAEGSDAAVPDEMTQQPDGGESATTDAGRPLVADAGDGLVADAGDGSAGMQLAPYSPTEELPGAPEVVNCEATVSDSQINPAIEWSFSGVGEERGALAIPLVADLEGDGSVEVVVSLYKQGDYFGPAHLYVLDGATGDLRFVIDHPVAAHHTPAIGDLDGDGALEIVSFGPVVEAGDPSADETGNLTQGRVLVFSATGSLLSYGDTYFAGGHHPTALADIDADGSVEILQGGLVADHLAKERFYDERGVTVITTTSAVDLDGDGQLEVIVGGRASRADGSIYYDHSEQIGAYLGAHAEVADLNADGQPEIVVHTDFGPALIGGDGTLLLRPNHEALKNGKSAVCGWHAMPGAIADLDGDGLPELVGNGREQVCRLSSDFSVLARTHIREDGYAGTSAFDFLGDGTLEVINADMRCLRVLGATGEVLWAQPRSNVTQIDFPVVADVDADGHAELLVVNNAGYQDDYEHPALVVYGDDSFAKARTLFNQHSYHTTNINADGSIPQYETPHYLAANTFRVMSSSD